MTAQNQAPFRREFLARRAERLEGDVSLAVPMSWHVIGYLLLATLFITATFLFSASYARVETVSGAIVLDSGVAPIIPSRPGIIVNVAVHEGMRVAAGDALATIRSEEDLAGGGTAARQMMEALDEQDRRLASQGDLVRRAAAAERSRLTAQIAGLDDELASLAAQILTQRRLVEVAQREFDALRPVVHQGFISRRDLDARETALHTRRLQLAQLEQGQAAKRSEQAEARRAMVQLAASAEAQASGVQSSRAEVLQRQAQVEATRGYTLMAPIGGTITALTARLGQPAAQNQPLMVISPDGGSPRAELHVSTQAAGFLAPGQEVRLAVDAFPYQRFGTIGARIASISSVAIPRQGPNGTAVPVYLVTADIVDPSVRAFGRREPLLPGMTLTARIVTEDQSLFEWLFEPLFAVSRR